MAFEEFGQLSKRRREERAQEFRKKILLFLLVILVLIAAVVGGIFAYLHSTKSKGKRKNDVPSSSPSGGGQGVDTTKTTNKIIQMLCDPTDYKTKCEDTLINVVRSNSSTPTIAPKLIIKAAISAASDEVITAISMTQKFTFDTLDEKAAFNVCKKLFKDSVDELGESLLQTGQDVKDFKSKIPDLKTWLSAVYSYQETCIDAFPEGESKTKIKRALNSTKEYVGNSLALVSKISSFLQQLAAVGGRRLLEHSAALNGPPDVDEDGFPYWVGREERRLSVKVIDKLVPNATVAKDGSGNFTSINDCLKSLPEMSNKRIYIYVKAGIYNEYVTVTQKMVNITMYGDGSQKTMVIGDKNFVDGVRTFETATFAVMGGGFMAIGMGFKNSAGPAKHQAVALRVQADKSIFLNCRMEAYQDTLYAQTHRQFYRSCYITGTIDFIFGDAAAIFQNCLLVVRKPLLNQQNIITAQGRADRHESTGFVLHNCRIQPSKDLEPIQEDFKTYLGRPWKEYSRTIVMQTFIGDVVDPAGWMPWQGQFALKTLYYAEYGNHGPGSDVVKRVKWPGYKRTITRKEAQTYTVIPFLQGSWIRDNPETLVHFGLYN